MWNEIVVGYHFHSVWQWRQRKLQAFDCRVIALDSILPIRLVTRMPLPRSRCHAMPCHNFIHFLTCISKLSALTYCLGRNERHLLSATANYGLSTDWYRSDYRVSQFPRFLHHENHGTVISRRWRWWWGKRRTSSKWVMHLFLCFESEILMLVTIIILSFIYHPSRRL